MRMIAIMGLAACLSGAAYASQSAEESERCEVTAERVDTAQIRRHVERALEHARAALGRAEVDAETRARAETRIAEAMAQLDEGLAQAHRHQLTSTQRAMIEARVAEAMSRAEHVSHRVALDAETGAQARAEIAVALAGIAAERAHGRAQLALAREHDLSEAERERIEAQVERAMERAEAALERAAEAMEQARERDGDESLEGGPR